MIKLITFTVNLKCDDCGADVTITDQKPEWKTDEDLRRTYEESAAWVEANKDRHFSTLSDNVLPPLVRVDSGLGFTGHPKLLSCPELRYIDCPCCDGRVYKGSGNTSARSETKGERP